MTRVSRRAFLKVSGSLAVSGGLALGLRLPAAAQGSSLEVNAWILVLPNETVVIRYARAELGQGGMTAAAQLVAEELECDWRRVRVEYADSNENLKRKRIWGPMVSARSSAIRESHELLRNAGASAREMLIAAAAKGWGVARAECRAANGVVTHAPSGRRMTYGRLAAAAAKLEVPKNIPLKPPSSWKLAVPRIEVPDIVTGHLRYAVDMQLPGMVHAAVAQSPVVGGRVRSVDEAAVRNRPGVLRVLAFEDFVAVVADNWWRASQALTALPIVWDGGGNERVSSERIKRYLRQGFDADAAATVVKRQGEPEAAIAEAERVFEFEYETPFLAHATLEPPGCTAVVKDGQVDVWTSTQDAEAAHAAAAEAADVAPANVHVHRMQAGGAFGRRLAQDYLRQAVRVARALGGVPVKLLWSREEDLQHDQYRPASLVKLRAGLDAVGYPVGVQCRVAAPAVKDVDATAALADQPYWIAHQQVEYVARNTPVPVGYWRGAAHSQNPFARECFLDELAHAGSHDPLAYRLELLPHSAKERAVLLSRRPRGRLGSRAAGRRAPRRGGLRSVWELHRRGGRAFGCRQEGASAPHRDGHRLRACRKPRQRHRADAGQRGLHAERALLGRDHAPRRVGWSNPTSTTTGSCASRRCPPSRCCSRLPAASGAASASPASPSWRPRSPTRSSPPRANPCARFRSRISATSFECAGVAHRPADPASDGTGYLFLRLQRRRGVSPRDVARLEG